MRNQVKLLRRILKGVLQTVVTLWPYSIGHSEFGYQNKPSYPVYLQDDGLLLLVPNHPDPGGLFPLALPAHGPFLGSKLGDFSFRPHPFPSGKGTFRSYAYHTGHGCRLLQEVRIPSRYTDRRVCMGPYGRLASFPPIRIKGFAESRFRLFPKNKRPYVFSIDNSVCGQLNPCRGR